MYTWLDIARDCHAHENYERMMSRVSGDREIDWDEETGYPSKFCGPQPDIPFWLFLIFCHIPSELVLWFRRKRCEMFGHDMVCTGYGGPDSGYDSGYCKKCDFSYHATMY